MVGSTDQFTATGTYSDGTTKSITSSVTWTSSATATATVGSGTGLATGVAAGSATITATLGSVSGQAALTVTAPVTLSSIAVTPAAPMLFNGTTEQLTATGTYSDGTTKDLTSSVTWTSSALTVATVSATAGLATGLSLGTTQVTAASASPSITSPAITLTVIPAEYAYAANFGSANVSQYSIATGGALTALNPTTVPAATGAFALAVEPTGHYLYVANFGTTAAFGSTVSEYSIGTAGLLTQLGTATAGLAPNGVTATASYVYVADYGSGTVSQYLIQGGGTLAPMPTPTVAAGQGPSMVALTAPSGGFAYVPNYIDGTVSAYAVNPTTGALTALGAAVAAGAGANFVAIDPTGKYAYVANLNGNSISQFSIAANGTLTPMTPATITTTNPRSIAIDAKAGPYVYVANGVSTANATAGQTVSQYTIGGTGTLVPMTPATVATGVGPNSVTVDATDQYVYVVNRGTVGASPVPGTTVQQFLIGPGGGLTPLTPPTAPAGTAPAAIVTSTAY